MFFINYYNKQTPWIILLDHNEIKINFYKYFNKFNQLYTKINVLIDEIDSFFDPLWLVLRYNISQNKVPLVKSHKQKLDVNANKNEIQAQGVINENKIQYSDKKNS